MSAIDLPIAEAHPCIGGADHTSTDEDQAEPVAKAEAVRDQRPVVGHRGGIRGLGGRWAREASQQAGKEKWGQRRPARRKREKPRGATAESVRDAPEDGVVGAGIASATGCVAEGVGAGRRVRRGG